MTAFATRPLQLVTMFLAAATALLNAAGCQSRLGHVPAAFRNMHESGVAVIGDG
jgi:hypothetical protein